MSSKFGWPAAALLLALLLACGGVPERHKGEPRSAPQEEATPRAETERKWYSGGTLHRKTMRDWRLADEADKLATAADIAFSFRKRKGEADADIVADEPRLRREAERIKSAIDATNPDGKNDHETVAAAAALVWALIQDE